jgi:integrase/recombinase XerD
VAGVFPPETGESSEKTPPNSIIQYVWELKKNGRAEPTQRTNLICLTQISKQCDINNPEKVKETLSDLKWANSTKNNFIGIYNGYLRFIGKTWTKPKYTEKTGLPFIPTEEELNILIASGDHKTATLLQILKETGARVGELEFLEWKHIDTQRKTIYITAEKGSNDRILPISIQLIEMLNTMSHINNKVFQTTKKGQRNTFDKLKKRVAKKINNPRLNEIHFHTFRHWKATMEYHKIRDIMHVKELLGHKDIESTAVYIHIEKTLWIQTTDEYTSIVTHNIDEETNAINSGFELVRAINETTAIYRKRK